MALEDPAVETHCSGALAARVSLTIIHAAPSGIYSILPCPPPQGACLGADGSRLTQAFDRYTGFAHRMRAQRVSIDSRGSRTSGGVGEHINRGSGQGVRKGYLFDSRIIDISISMRIEILISLLTAPPNSPRHFAATLRTARPSSRRTSGATSGSGERRRSDKLVSTH